VATACARSFLSIDEPGCNGPKWGLNNWGSQTPTSATAFSTAVTRSPSPAERRCEGVIKLWPVYLLQDQSIIQGDEKAVSVYAPVAWCFAVGV
jgi:hypothetical protein